MSIKPSSSYLISQILYRLPHSFLVAILILTASLVPLAIGYSIYMYLQYGIDQKLPSSPTFWILFFSSALLVAYIKNIINDVFYVNGTSITSDAEKVVINLGGLSRSSVTYPIKTISNAIINQNITQRCFGNCTLIISGEFDEDIAIVGLPFQQTQELVNQLTTKS